MTAEVALLNRHAVALAADSAVTLGSVGRPMKIYNTANKLHMLADDQPVGIMVYNNAELVGVGWEALIKQFRAEFGSKSFPDLEGYLDAFISFLCGRALSLIPEEMRTGHLLSSVTSLLEALKIGIEEELLRPTELSKAGRVQVAGRVVNQFLDWIMAYPLLHDINQSDSRRELERLDDELEQTREAALEGLPLSKTAISKVDRIVVESMARAVPTPDYSGVVIAGFGEERIFPQLRSFRAFGFMGDKLRRTTPTDVDISFENNAYVGSFAQSDMVGTFMEGLDPNYRRFLDLFMHDSLSGLAGVVISRVSAIEEGDDVSRAELNSIFDELEEELSEQVSAYRQENHVDPVISSVALMPKEELTRLAEALVSLTSLKRRATMDHETVGGPVDVAVITKGDGFVWLERKHYFSPELNPRFIARYYNKTRRR